MEALGQLVLVVGDSAAAERAAARLEAAGQHVRRSAWSSAHSSEVERSPAPADSAAGDALLAYPPPATASDDARWPALFELVRAGGAVVLAGSMSPRAAASLADDAEARGLAFLDAPTAADGGLIPVGGDEAALEGARPLLACLGVPVRQGAAGSGQQARLCSEIALMGSLIGLCEALAYARAAGLDADRLLPLLPGLGQEAGARMVERARRMLGGTPGDAETVAGLVADADAVLEEAETIELDLPGLELSRLLYREVADMGYAAQGAEALCALWQDEEGEAQQELVQIRRP